MKLARYLYFLLPLLLCAVISCDKDRGADDDPSIIGEVVTSVSKGNGLPGEVIEIQFSFGLDQDVYDVVFAGDLIRLYRITDSTALFYVPFMPAGNYFLNLSNIKPALQIAFDIESYPALPSEQSLKQEVWASLDGMFQDMAVFSAMKSKFEDGLAEMSDEDRRVYLFTYRNLVKQITSEQEMERIANVQDSQIGFSTSLSIMDPHSSSVRGDARSASASRAEQRYEDLFLKPAFEYQRCIKGIILVVIGDLLVVEGTKIASRFLGPTVIIAGTVMTVGGAILLVGLTNNAIAAVDLLYKNIEIAFTADFKEQEGRGAPRDVRAAVGKVSDPMDFEKGKSIERLVEFTFYSFSLELEGKTNSNLLNSLFGTYRNMKNKYDKVHRFAGGLANFFSVGNILPSSDKLIPQKSQRQDKEVDAAYIEIENISNPNIHVEVSGGKEGIVFNIPNNTIDKKVEFRFDIVIRQERIGTVARKTIKATYDGTSVGEAIQIVSGNLQVGLPGQRLSKPLQITVTDFAGDGIKNARVYWTAESGSGTLQRSEGYTDEFGIAENSLTLGQNNIQHVKATIKSSKNGTSVEQSVNFYAFWDLTGEWKATELVWTDWYTGRKINAMDWVDNKDNYSEYKMSEVKLTVREGFLYHFSEIMTSRIKSSGSQWDQSAEYSNRYGFDIINDLPVIRFVGMSGKRVFKVLTFTPTEIYMEYLGVEGQASGWTWTDNFFFPHNSGTTMRMRKQSGT